MGVFKAKVTRKQSGVFDLMAMSIKDSAYRGIFDGGKQMEKAAKMNVADHSLSGQLANSITLNIQNPSGSVIVAAIRPAHLIQAYTLEFGATGVTNGSPWFVHESQTPYNLNEMYGFPILRTNNGSFYVIHRLKPHHYLSNAFTSTKDTVVYMVADAVRADLGLIQT